MTQPPPDSSSTRPRTKWTVGGPFPLSRDFRGDTHTPSLFSPTHSPARLPHVTGEGLHPTQGVLSRDESTGALVKATGVWTRPSPTSTLVALRHRGSPGGVRDGPDPPGVPTRTPTFTRESRERSGHSLGGWTDGWWTLPPLGSSLYELGLSFKDTSRDLCPVSRPVSVTGGRVRVFTGEVPVTVPCVCRTVFPVGRVRASRCLDNPREPRRSRYSSQTPNPAGGPGETRSPGRT